MIWELIRANKRKSILLLAVMAFVLFGLGGFLGMLFAGQKGVIYGVIIAGVVFMFLTLLSYSAGDQILLASSKAKEVTKDVHPQLFNIVEEMTIAAQLSKMPKIYIIPDPAPNAFATGRNPENASVAVTAGLLGRLNRDELQGVIAHEISHVVHRDILYVTLAGIMLGSIVLLSDLVVRSVFYGAIFGGGSSRRYSSRRNDNGGAALVLIIAVIAAILAPIFAQVLYFSLSRKREYLADAGAVRLTRYPQGLASALEKISSSKIPMETANKATAPMYISPPLTKDKMSFAGIGMTHPPIDKRIKILRNMTHGASLGDYDNAYSMVTGSKSAMPALALKDKENVELRNSGNGSVSMTSAKKQTKEINDLMRVVNGFMFLNCTCGLKIKMPPDFKSSNVKCPKCGKVHKVA